MRRKLEVTNTELLHMRDNGMTNRDIANSLGVSYHTILKRIGPQPGKNWGDYQRRMAEELPGQMNVKDYEEPENNAEACLLVTNTVMYLEGDAAEWAIECKANNIMCKTDAVINIPFDKFDDYVKEVLAIQRHLKDCRVPLEMW